MKKIKYVILTLSVATLLGACQGLDEKLYSSYDSNDFYKTPVQLQAASYAMYADFSASSNTGWEVNMHYLSTPLSMYTITTANDLASFVTFQFDYTTKPFEYIWSVYYNAINHANEVIKYAGNVVTADPNLITRHIAEARFIRAYSYYCLTVLFGAVPMRTSPTEREADAYLGCTSVERILNEVVIPDLKFAVENMPYKWEGEAVAGRATKKSARFLLAKVYLQMAGTYVRDENNKLLPPQPARYQDVIETLLPMMENRSQYHVGLIPGAGMATIWDGSAKDNDEILLCWGSSRESYGSQMPYFMLPRHDARFGAIWTIFPNPKFGISESLYNIYAANDLRKAFIVKSYTYKNQTTMQLGERTYGGTGYNLSGGRGMGICKYTDPLATGNSSAINDKVVYRFAEALLVMAEAYNETGQPDLALKYLNEVRARANVSLSTTTDQDALRAEIRQERILELVGEWADVFDIRRLDEGKYNFVNHHYINDYLFAFSYMVPFDLGERYDANKIKWSLYPLPRRELDFNTEIMKNNPGWGNDDDKNQ